MNAFLDQWLTPVLMMVAVLLVFPLLAGYIVLVERKVLADMQVRLGPMRVGPHGLMQPLADALKLMLKEDIVPAGADRFIFWAAPITSTFTALTAFTVIPFSQGLRITDVNIGLLVISAMASIGILGLVLGGWASNSHYSLLGSLRSAAQLVSYEVALALAILNGVMAAGSLSMVRIVEAQREQGVWFAFANYGFMLVAFYVFLIAGTAESNRLPFDLPEAESELVAGFHTEYSGFRWVLFMLAEYGNLFVLSSMGVTLFWGGWLRPFPGVAWLDVPLNYGVPVLLFAGTGAWCFPLAGRLKYGAHRVSLRIVGGVLGAVGALLLHPGVNEAVRGPFWFFAKVAVLIYLMIWFRGTWPRFRYDQLMDIGWKRLIPLGLVCLLVNAVLGLVGR